MHLDKFLCKLFNDSNSKNEFRINSNSNTVSNGRFLTTKHVFLPLPSNLSQKMQELVKIMNRLRHEVSRSKVLEIEKTIVNSKLSSSTTLIPNDINQHIATTAVYDNIDRVEETLSGCGTTHQVNGVLVQ